MSQSSLRLPLASCSTYWTLARRNIWDISLQIKAGQTGGNRIRVFTESRSRYSTNPPSSSRAGETTTLNPQAPSANILTTSSDVAKRQTQVTMASDSDYASFLDKVNQDPAGGVAREESHGGREKGFKTTDQGVQIPTVLKKAVVDAFYVSDADEPFEVVGLAFGDGTLPDEGMSLYPLLLLFLSFSIAVPCSPICSEAVLYLLVKRQQCMVWLTRILYA